MENIKKQKVGAGILTIAIITFIGSAFGLIGSIISMSDIDKTNAGLKSLNLPETTIFALVISLVFTAIITLAVILILMKKEIGIYIYFIAVVANIVYTVVVNGFKPIQIASFIMPVLMAIFIWKKKEVFGLGAKVEDVSL